MKVDQYHYPRGESACAGLKRVLFFNPGLNPLPDQYKEDVKKHKLFNQKLWIILDMNNINIYLGSII